MSARTLCISLALTLAMSEGASAQSASAGRADARVGASGAFLALSVPDLRASIAWYSRVFDMQQTFTVPAMGPIAGGALLEGHGFIVELLQHREAQPGRTPPELQFGVAKAGFLVDDFDGLVRDLRARGVPFLYEPQPARPGQRPNLMVRDTSGIVLQFLGPKQAP